MITSWGIAITLVGIPAAQFSISEILTRLNSVGVSGATYIYGRRPGSCLCASSSLSQYSTWLIIIIIISAAFLQNN